MNNAVRVLFDEHKIILSAIDIAKEAGKLIEKNEIIYERLIRELINFFRVYADQYHHYKEEKILFPEMNKKNELLEDGVIKEMLENHEDFRNLIKSIENFIDNKNYRSAQKQLDMYTEALLDHIAVENDEVFQMAETLFDNNELDRIYFCFEDCDREIQKLASGKVGKIELADQLNEMRKVLM